MKGDAKTPGEHPIPRSLDELLQAFRDASQELEAAIGDQVRISGLIRARDKKVAGYRERLEQENFALEEIRGKIYDLGVETEEHKAIESIHGRIDNATREIQWLRTAGLLPLRTLPIDDPEAKYVLEQITNLTGVSDLDAAKIIVGLLETLQRPRHRKRAGKPDRAGKDLTKLKHQVRALHEKGLDHSEICKRLDLDVWQLPPGAKWHGATNWVEALKRYRNRVRTWLSKAIHE